MAIQRNINNLGCFMSDCLVEYEYDYCEIEYDIKQCGYVVRRAVWFNKADKAGYSIVQREDEYF